MNACSRWLAVITVAAGLGCAIAPSPDYAARRNHAEREILARGLNENPRVQAKRAALEAAEVQRDSQPWVDEFDLRTSVSGRRDEAFRVLARIPLDQLTLRGAEHGVRKAEVETALAELETTTLETRVKECLPSLERQVLEERKQLFETYAERQHALLDWSADLQRAGQLDAVGAAGFALETEVRLARRELQEPTLALGPVVGNEMAVLPRLSTEGRPLSLLDTSAAQLQAQLSAHQPGLRIPDAERRRFEALADRAKRARYPRLGFVEAGYEPLAVPGAENEWRAGASVEIPLGFEARADEKRYAALARGRRSEGRAQAELRIQEGLDALGILNRFRSGQARWQTLLEQAAAAEATADRWWKARATSPTRVSSLLDEVYSARRVVIEAREEAGRAHCALLAATGVESGDWPEAH